MEFIAYFSITTRQLDDSIAMKYFNSRPEVFESFKEDQTWVDSESFEVYKRRNCGKTRILMVETWLQGNKQNKVFCGSIPTENLRLWLLAPFRPKLEINLIFRIYYYLLIVYSLSRKRDRFVLVIIDDEEKLSMGINLSHVRGIGNLVRYQLIL